MQVADAIERMTDHFVLSDFLYSDSIVRRGLVNLYDETRTDVEKNGKALMNLLGHIADEHGHLSIVYGYISPDVSMRTVKWRDPAGRSYHRWDDGAAADFIAHDWLGVSRKNGQWNVNPDADCSPMMLAREIAASHEFSRMITYSESPSICVAAHHLENRDRNHRRAFYENRYQGEPYTKPKYLRYHGRIPSREEVRTGVGEFGWVGDGHPSYHGKGRKQYHHIRIGRYLTMLECLRCPLKLIEGVPNRPPHSAVDARRFMKVGYAMSRFMEWYYHFSGHGFLSVVAGHNSRTDNTIMESLYVDVEHMSRDWGTGEGSMVFAISEEFSNDFIWAWAEHADHAMDDYHMSWARFDENLLIKISWSSK